MTERPHEGDGVSSRCIAEKTGCPGLIMKVMNGSWDVLFCKEDGHHDAILQGTIM